MLFLPASSANVASRANTRGPASQSCSVSDNTSESHRVYRGLQAELVPQYTHEETIRRFPAFGELPHQQRAARIEAMPLKQVPFDDHDRARHLPRPFGGVEGNCYRRFIDGDIHCDLEVETTATRCRARLNYPPAALLSGP